jgi:hypothetical protein
VALDGSPIQGLMEGPHDMKVHILSYSHENKAASWLKESSRQDPFGKHLHVEDPQDADIVLFTESHPANDPYLLGVLRHPVYRRYAKKCFLYADTDFSLPIIRGLYPSILKQDYKNDRCRSFGYIARLAPNPFIQYKAPSGVKPKWLYTFVGDNNCQVRSDLFSQAHPDGFIKNTTGKHHWELEGPEQDEFMRSYADSIQDSAFVLCPRGNGPTSYRLFETMEMGKVPVIFSDEWVPPPGPAWEKFSLILRENQVGRIGTILRQTMAKYEEMGREARLAWEQYFAKPVCFHRMTELCAELLSITPEPFSQIGALSKLLRPDRLKIQLRPFIKKCLGA